MTLPIPLFELIGLAGTALYVVAYFCVATGGLDGNSDRYFLLNLSAACCVLYSLSYAFNLPSVVIQMSWLTLSLWALARRLVKRAATVPRKLTTSVSREGVISAPELEPLRWDAGRSPDISFNQTYSNQTQSYG